MEAHQNQNISKTVPAPTLSRKIFYKLVQKPSHQHCCLFRFGSRNFTIITDHIAITWPDAMLKQNKSQFKYPLQWLKSMQYIQWSYLTLQF